MIILDFAFAISLFFVFFFVAMFLIWLLCRKEKEKNILLQPRYTWHCSICAYTYINTHEEPITICPRCGSYNKKEIIPEEE